MAELLKAEDKMDWESTRILDDVLPEARGHFEHHFEFYKGPLLVGTYQAVFDHVISRGEMIKYFKQFYDVRDEQYSIKLAHVHFITEAEEAALKRDLTRLGYYSMAPGVVDMQNKDLLLDKILAKPEFQAKLNRTQRRKGL